MLLTISCFFLGYGNKNGWKWHELCCLDTRTFYHGIHQTDIIAYALWILHIGKLLNGNSLLETTAIMKRKWTDVLWKQFNEEGSEQILSFFCILWHILGRKSRTDGSELWKHVALNGTGRIHGAIHKYRDSPVSSKAACINNTWKGERGWPRRKQGHHVTWNLRRNFGAVKNVTWCWNLREILGSDKNIYVTRSWRDNPVSDRNFPRSGVGGIAWIWQETHVTWSWKDITRFGKKDI